MIVLECVLFANSIDALLGSPNKARNWQISNSNITSGLDPACGCKNSMRGYDCVRHTECATLKLNLHKIAGGPQGDRLSVVQMLEYSIEYQPGGGAVCAAYWCNPGYRPASQYAGR